MTTRWVVSDGDSWDIYDTEDEAMAAWDDVVATLREEGADYGWPDGTEAAYVGRLVMHQRIRLRWVASAEDDTSLGEDCRRRGWDYMAAADVLDADGNVLDRGQP